ncbi:unnamed protein product [Cuscuta epithymum]|uniref:Uncharacterized protein n=1 Tax=Cuscuta epithymum TaxID=186058 RepID=A0AAV0FR76_9ASTE|nr:unnamed protein product [Cuscuta epithymum]
MKTNHESCSKRDQNQQERSDTLQRQTYGQSATPATPSRGNRRWLAHGEIQGTAPPPLHPNKRTQTYHRSDSGNPWTAGNGNRLIVTNAYKSRMKLSSNQMYGPISISIKDLKKDSTGTGEN